MSPLTIIRRSMRPAIQLATTSAKATVKTPTIADQSESEPEPIGIATSCMASTTLPKIPAICKTASTQKTILTPFSIAPFSNLGPIMTRSTCRMMIMRAQA